MARFNIVHRFDGNTLQHENLHNLSAELLAVASVLLVVVSAACTLLALLEKFNISKSMAMVWSCELKGQFMSYTGEGQIKVRSKRSILKMNDFE